MHFFDTSEHCRILSLVLVSLCANFSVVFTSNVFVSIFWVSLFLTLGYLPMGGVFLVFCLKTNSIPNSFAISFAF